MSLRRTLLVAFALSSVPLLGQEVMKLELPKSELVKVIIRYRDVPRAGGLATTAAQSFELTTNDVERTGARVERRFTRLLTGVSATVRRSELAAIRALPGVASVREDVRVHATLAQSVPATRADRVWQQFGTRGAGQTVAIIDTGIDLDHEAFGNRIAGGWDFANDDANPNDDNGHGTHVAGIVGANGAGLTGVAPDVNLLAYKVLGKDGSGDSSAVIAALERAVDPNEDGNTSDHADVVNLSLGAPPIEDDPLIEAVDNAVAAGVVVVASAGNSGAFYSVGTPGVAASAITVGALTRDNTLADFSSRGPTAHQLLGKPEILAPGVGIVSARMSGGATAKSGTSMAAPHIAGIAALLRAIHPDWTPAEVKSALVANAIPVAGEVVETGTGRVDALAAAEATLFATPSVLSFGVTSGMPQQYSSLINLSLTNRGTKSVTVGVKVASGERPGLDVITPSSTVVAPNQTQVLPVRLRVDNALLPVPTRGSLSFGGVLTLQFGLKVIRVPWMFVKAATVTIDWESGGEYGGILTGADFVQSFVAQGPGQTKFFVPAQSFDLAMISGNGDGSDSLLLFENQESAGNTILHASRAMATHTITTAIVDHHGTPITPVPRAEGEGPSVTTKCGQHLVFRLPGRRADTIRYDTEMRRLKIGDVPSKTVLLFENCGVPETSSAYTVDRSIPLPLDRDYTLTNDPSEYVVAPIRIAKPLALPASGYGVLGTGVTVRTSGGGYGYSIPHVRSRAKGLYWDGTLYMTRPVDTKVVSSVISGIAPGGTSGGAVLDTPVMRVEGNRIVTARGLTDAPNEFSAEAGETIEFGEGPMYPASHTASDDRIFTSFHEWRGLLGEYYRREITGTQIQLYDEAGTLLESTDYLCCSPLPPGFYKVVATGELRTARGIDRSTVITTVDTRRDDTVPPSLNTVRILDGDGRVTRELSDRGTFAFSVEDTKLNAMLENPFEPMPTDRVTFAWRRHGTTAWISAPTTLTADDQGHYETLGHPATGVHFRADLAPALATRGPIDVKVSFADAAGNTTEWIGESVFTSVGGKRRTVRR